jgi:hypothetical protein
MYLARSNTQLYFLDRLVGIVRRLREAMARKSSSGLQSAWFGLFEAAFLYGNGNDTGSIDDGRAMGRCLEEEPATKDKQCRSNHDDPEVVSNLITKWPKKQTDLHQRYQVSNPKPDMRLNIDCNQRRKRTHVDGPVKPTKHALNRQLRVHNHPFASSQLLRIRCVGPVLLCAHGRNIRFDTACTQSNHYHGRNQPAKTGARLDSRRRRCSNEYHETNNVNTAPECDCLEAAEILVRNDGADDSGGVGPEFEKVAQGCSDSLTAAEGAGEVRMRVVWVS